MSHPKVGNSPRKPATNPFNIESMNQNLAKDPFNPLLINSARKLLDRDGGGKSAAAAGSRSNKKRVMPQQELSLGYPVGLTQGTFNQSEMRVNKSVISLLTICTSYYAFAYTYIRPPVRWCPKTINDIVIAGAGLLKATEQRCQRLQLALTEANVLRKFQIENYCLEVVAAVEPEIIGNLVAPLRQKVLNIYRGLKQFFARPLRRGCLFRCDAVQLLIWREERIYFVFDARGRTEACTVDVARGFASLVCLETLRNVTFLLVHMSELGAHDFFVLSEVRVEKLLQVAEAPAAASSAASSSAAAAAQALLAGGGGGGGPEPPERAFVVLGEHSAILHGSLTVSNPCFTRTRNYQALTSCCIAYVYSLIRPPNAWTSRTVDKVLLLGNQMYEECVRQNFPEEFTIQNIPPMLTVGAFKAALRIMPFQHGGRLHHAVDHRSSELMLALRQFFDENGCALLQIDQLTFVAWRRADVYYLFDPYVRDAGGNVMRHAQGAACLHMHSTLESLGRVLYGNLMRLAEKEVFYVHGLWARVMDKRAAGDEATAAFSDNATTLTSLQQRSESDKEDDAASLNESIDSVYVPRLQCRGRHVEPNSATGPPSRSECNLDSPSVSATQFIRPWHMMKDEVMKQLPDIRSGSEESGLSDFDDGGDGGDGGGGDGGDDNVPNNDLGLSNADYNRLLEAGLSDDEIRQYTKAGTTPDEMIAWRQEGVSPADVARLRAAGVTAPGDFKQYRRWGMNVADCERMSQLGIEPRQYAKMKKMGVEPDRMVEQLAAKENADQFREANLNNCQIVRLSQQGVTAAEFEKATNEGLTYEEVLHAAQNDIPAEEFAKMKDTGMSSVDIVKAKQMGLTPEEYMDMKEMGLSGPEMAALKKNGITAEEFAALRKLGYSTEEHLSEYAKMKSNDPAMTPAKYHAHKTGNSDAGGDTLGKENATTEEKEKDTAEGDQPTTKPLGSKSAVTGDATGIETHEKEPLAVPASSDPEAGTMVKQAADAPPANSSLQVIAQPEIVSGDITRQSKTTTLDIAESMNPDAVSTSPVGSKTDAPPAPDLRESPSKTCAPKPAALGSKTDAPELLPTGSTQSPIQGSKPGSPQSPLLGSKPGSPQSPVLGSKPGSPQSPIGSKTVSLPASATTDAPVPADGPGILAETPSALKHITSGPKQNMAVVKSAACTPASFHKLLNASFKMVDRVLILNNKDEPTCVAFKDSRGPPPADQKYFLYEGCPCNLEQIRRLIVAKSKAFLTPCRSLDDMIERIIRRLRPAARCGLPAAPEERRCVLVPDQQQAARFARELLDEKLELINARLNDLMKDFQTLKCEEQ